MADCVNPKTKRKRAKTQRRRQRKSITNSNNQTKENEENTNENDVKEDYKVDFPDTGASKPKIKAKSKSLDDDDTVKIQEVDETCEEDKHQCEAIVSEAESDWEEITDLRVPQAPVALSTLAITIDEEPIQRATNFSPEEELSLRNFLEGLNLVDSPEGQLSSTLDSIKKEKVRKRDALMTYFTPLVHNPRFLDIISEEGSDLSDRESSTLTRHLKQGTPEFESRNVATSQQSPRATRRNKLKRLQLKREEEKAVLVCTKIVDTPSIIEHIHTCTSENVEPEKVFLESTGTSSSESSMSPSVEEEERVNEEDESNDEKVDCGKEKQNFPGLNPENMEEKLHDEVIQAQEEIKKLLEPNSSDVEEESNNTQTYIEEATDKHQLETYDLLKKPEDHANIGKETLLKQQEFKSDDINEKVHNEYPQTDNVLRVQLDVGTNVSREEENVDQMMEKCDQKMKKIVLSQNRQLNQNICVNQVDHHHNQIDISGDKSSMSRNEVGSENIRTDYVELTPPPTPEHSPKKKLSAGSSLDSDLDECMKELSNDTAKEIASVLCKLDKGFETAFIVNQAFVPSIEEPIVESLPMYSPSFSGSSSRETSPSTVRLNLKTCSSIADVASISTDLELAKEASLLKQPLTLRELCLLYLITSPYGHKLSTEFSEVAVNFESLAAAGNETKEKLESAASFKPINFQDANNSNLISEVTEKLKKIMASKKWAGLPFYNNPNLLLYLSPSQREKIENENEPEIPHEFHSKCFERVSSKEERNIEITSFEKETVHKTTDISYSRSTSKTLPRDFKQANPRLRVSNLDEWLDIARESDKIMKQDHSSKHPEHKCVGGDNTSKRRISLPDELFQRQLQMILDKEKEIEQELENLLEEKRKLYVEMRNTQENLSELHESNHEKVRPKSFPQSPNETLRQKMYEEYMKQVAEREDRKHHKMIKITSTPINKSESDKSQFEAVHLPGIEDEFMKRVQERHGPLEKVEEETTAKEETEEEKTTKTSSVLLIDGKSVKEASDLPKHLREFVEIAAETVEEPKPNGIWSPGQKREFIQTEFDRQVNQQKNDESIPSIWQPKSATSSPVAERKEFRPVSFESPKLGRKNKPNEFQVKSSGKSTSRPPLQDSVPRVETQQVLTLERRIPNSRSAPVTGFDEISTGRLPKAQNPTVILLQKAREGQLPRGANYLESNRDHYRIPQEFGGQGEINHIRRNDHYSESDSEVLRSSDIHRPKFEGVGPVSSDGMPLSLRSEVRDTNQSKWYKKMYDTIHKQKPYRDEYVTVRYKPRRAQYPYISGYLSEPEPGAYESDMEYKYATLDRRRTPMEKENFTTSTMPRNSQWRTTSSSDYSLGSKTNPGRIENYMPGRSSISDQESKKWWDEVMDIFDGKLEDDKKAKTKGYMSQALKESGYESDSTLVFRKREDGSQISPSEQREAYKIIQKGGDVPLHGLRKPAPERPKEPEPPVPPPKSHQSQSKESLEGSPRKYVENQVTIHYKTPVRQEVKDYYSEDELAHRQQEAMKKIYQEEKRRKYLQELQDIHNRRHTDNFIPSQKSPIPLNRYDDFDELVAPNQQQQHRIRPRSAEPRLVARALYNFVGMTPRELTFRKGDNIFVRRQIDKNWYEGELNAMVGLFPVNYVEIIPYENVKTTITTRKPNEGQARAKYNFLAKTYLELSLAKGEMVILTRRVDNNWYEGKIGGRKGIFPASYVDVLIDPQEPPKENTKPIAVPAAHSLLINGSSVRESMGSHTYTPNNPNQETSQLGSFYAKPAQANYCSSYRNNGETRISMNQALHVDTQSAEPVPYKALYKYMPQNNDELELMEGDSVFVLEKCDDGWFVGSNERTGAFGTFPGNYVEKA